MSKHAAPLVSFLLVDPVTGCHESQGWRDKNGYGMRRVGGRTSAGRNIRAHRQAWEAVHGPIPEGMMVLHRCDNPCCCYVDHLFLGTQLDNVRDASAKGRLRRPPPEYCIHGHPYDDANTYISRSGRRQCRTCGRLRMRNKRAKADVLVTCPESAGDRTT